MRTKEEIKNRLRNYEKNRKLHLATKQAKYIIAQAILELNWVLGQENNHENVGRIK